MKRFDTRIRITGLAGCVKDWNEDMAEHEIFHEITRIDSNACWWIRPGAVYSVRAEAV